MDVSESIGGKDKYMNMCGNSRKAFTLIEVLLVIVIVGIMAGMMVIKLSGRSQEARITRAQSDIRGTLSLALDMFEQDLGRYPTTEEGLESLVSDPDIPGWKGPYLKGELKEDPWGNPYVYSLDSEGTAKYELNSSGPDGMAGTDDDIQP